MRPRAALALALCLVAALPAVGQTPSAWLVLPKIDATGRRPFRPDAVFATYLAEPGQALPELGASLHGELGEAAWLGYDSDEPGRLSPEAAIGWAFAKLEVEEAGIFLASLRGGWRFFLDGAPFEGDGYGYGFGGTPVWLEAGSHALFVNGLRGPASFQLMPHESGLVPATWDVLVPDIVLGDFGPGVTAGGVAALELPLLNASTEAYGGGRFLLREARREGEGGTVLEPRIAEVRGVLPSIEPLARAPLSIQLAPGPAFEAAEAPARVELELFLGDLEGEGEPDAVLSLRLVERATTRRVAFRSAIDGSLQEYGLVVPTGAEPDGLVLSLHGASVPAINQARAYAPKDKLWIVAPLNRRPYGFDWQDWGRLDAYEALDAALEQTRIDDERVVVTGHSMGGHGTWHLAVNDPDRFLAVAPSAGWASFDTYGGRPEGDLAELWQRADGTSRTLDLIGNLVGLPLYVLHGTADDNVPISEAERLLAALQAAGGTPAHHFQEGAGHWWGNQCVDWPPLFELFRSALDALGEDGRVQPDALDFITIDPGVDSEHYWVRVLQPRTYGEPVHITASWDPQRRLLEVSASSAGALRLAAPNRKIPLEWKIDGQTFQGSATQRSLWIERADSGAWVLGRPASGMKVPGFSGPFKRAFESDFLFVVGTAGEALEDTALFETARYLQADWSYRAGGEVELITDADFLASDRSPGRNVILFGNRDSNRAWGGLLGAQPPIDVAAGTARYGATAVEGGDLLALFVLPRADDVGTLVGAFGSSGVRAARLAAQVPVFVSGVGLPDWTLIDRAVLEDGDGGVVAAGYFDRGWQLSPPAFERSGAAAQAPK